MAAAQLLRGALKPSVKARCCSAWQGGGATVLRQLAAAQQGLVHEVGLLGRGVGCSRAEHQKLLEAVVQQQEVIGGRLGQLEGWVEPLERRVKEV